MFISGPINIVRLEGKINNIEKIIYIFFDDHTTITRQTECESYDNIDIISYLKNLFKKSEKTLDFFFEIKSKSISDKQDIYKTRYIEDIQKLYNRIHHDKETKKHIKSNIRFHYMDIRDYLEKNIYVYRNNLKKAIHDINVKQNINLKDFNTIIESCVNLIYELDIYDKYFQGHKPNKQNKIFYFLNKITQKYKYPFIIENFHKEYIIEIKQEISELIKIIKSLHKLILTQEDYVNRIYDIKYETHSKYNYGSNYLPKLHPIIEEMNKLNEDIYSRINYIFAKLTDLFFLRRFLDKDYINLAITYSGAAHSINFVHSLVSLFNFKITHYSFSEEKDLDKLNNIAKSDVAKLGYTLKPKYLIQCSDLSNFPNDFGL